MEYQEFQRKYKQAKPHVSQKHVIGKYLQYVHRFGVFDDFDKELIGNRNETLTEHLLSKVNSDRSMIEHTPPIASQRRGDVGGLTQSDMYDFNHAFDSALQELLDIGKDELVGTTDAGNEAKELFAGKNADWVDYPTMFEEQVEFLKTLSNNELKAIYYYTSGAKSKDINRFITGELDSLHQFQRSMYERLLGVYERVPPIQHACVVFRGFKFSTLSGRMFNSTSKDKSVGIDFAIENNHILSSKHTFITNKRGVDTPRRLYCCFHAIHILPGAKALFFGSEWLGITPYVESEVLLGPGNGKFVHIGNTRIRIFEGQRVITHKWVYVPNGHPLYVPEGHPLEKQKRQEIIESLSLLTYSMNEPYETQEGITEYIKEPMTATSIENFYNPEENFTVTRGQWGLRLPNELRKSVRIVKKSTFVDLKNRTLAQPTLCDFFSRTLPDKITGMTQSKSASLRVQIAIFEDGQYERVWTIEGTDSFGTENFYLPVLDTSWEESWKFTTADDLVGGFIQLIYENYGVLVYFTTYNGNPYYLKSNSIVLYAIRYAGRFIVNDSIGGVSGNIKGYTLGRRLYSVNGAMKRKRTEDVEENEEN